MKTSCSYRLSSEAIYFLKELAKAKGISQASLLEMMLREAAKKEKISTPKAKPKARTAA